MTSRDTFPLGCAFGITLSYFGVLTIAAFIAIEAGVAETQWWREIVVPANEAANVFLMPVKYVFLVWIGWLWRSRRCNGRCRA